MAGYWNSRAWQGKAKKADSDWEDSLSKGVLKSCEHHNKNYDVEYTIDKVYENDFWIKQKSGRVLYIEAKGCFRDKPEAAKYRWIRLALKDEEELVFLFQKPNQKIIWANKRKDGTKMTHAQWADYHGFRWFDEETIKEIL